MHIDTAILQRIESIFKILALIFAAGFFGWKIIAGWLIVNLEVSIETTRQAKDAAFDWLVVKLLLKKGNTDALWLKDIATKVYDDKGNDVGNIIRYNEFSSLAIKDKKYIHWKKPVKARKFTIAPEEVFQMEKIIIVPFDKPLIIETAVFGKRAFWPKGFQWRASAASLPLKDRKIN